DFADHPHRILVGAAEQSESRGALRVHMVNLIEHDGQVDASLALDLRRATLPERGTEDRDAPCPQELADERWRVLHRGAKRCPPAAPLGGVSLVGPPPRMNVALARPAGRAARGLTEDRLPRRPIER